MNTYIGTTYFKSLQKCLKTHGSINMDLNEGYEYLVTVHLQIHEDKSAI